MKYEAAMALADALESGVYKQCHNNLGQVGLPEWNGEEHNCCLGVECRLAGAPRTVLETTADSNSLIRAIRYGEGGHASIGFLPVSVQLAHGWQSHNGEFVDGSKFEYAGGCFETLLNMNDAGVPFAVIAKAVREKWKVL
jgi:hypothetical protein